MGKLTRRIVKKAIPDSGGVISVIARRCDISYSSVWSFFHKDRNKDLFNLLNKEKERIVDLAETQLFKKIREGKDWAIKFMLTTQGKGRGYVPQQEVLQHEFKKVEIEFLNPSPNKEITETIEVEATANAEDKD